jgi:hypothetical protein
MSDISEQIKTTFQNIITIYEETSSLLLDASSNIEKQGFQVLHGNTLGTEQSKDINSPKWWITPYGARYFAIKEYPEIIKGLAVVFVDIDQSPIEPIIIIGSFKMKKDEEDEVLPFYYYYLRRAWFDLGQNRKLNVDLEIEGKWNYHEGSIRSVLLEKVKDQKSLQAEIIEPFLRLS